MKVGELMNRRVLKISPNITFSEVLQLMLRFHLNDITVVKDEGQLVGILTYSDLCRRFLPSERELMENEQYFTNPELIEDRFKDILNVQVKEIMTRDVKTVTPDTDATKAGGLMNAYHVKQLPVVQNDEVVGIISHTDIGWGLMMKYIKPIQKYEKK